MQQSDLSGAMDRFIALAERAGEAIMAVRRRGFDTAHKDDGSPVTAADRASEAIIVQGLGEIAPGVVVVSEENAASHAVAPPQRYFLVDPLDGTREFLRDDALGEFTVNIAVIENREPVLGVVHAPALGRTFAGSRAGGAFEIERGRRQAIRVRRKPASGPVAVASRSHRDGDTDRWLAERGITETRSIGSSLKFCLVAAGEADVYPRFGPTMEWDTAAGDAILRAAGGRVETPEGEALTYGKAGYRNGPFIACSGM